MANDGMIGVQTQTTSEDYMDGIDMDSILGEGNRLTPDDGDIVPMSSEPGEGSDDGGTPKPAGDGPVPIAPAAKEAPPADGKTETIVWNGQEIKLTPDEKTNLAQKAYNYDQKMEQLAAERQAWEREKSQGSAEHKQQIEQLQTKLSRFQEIDTFIQTPEGQAWWDNVNSEWAKRGGTAEPANPVVMNRITELETQLKQALEKVNGFETKTQEAERTQADQALDAQVKEFREQHPNIGWDQLDGNGRTLEQQIYDHAVANNIGSFRAAALDYAHDKILAAAETRKKEAEAKAKQKRTKAGVISESTSTSVKPYDPSSGDHQEGYMDLANDALKELGYGS